MPRKKNPDARDITMSARFSAAEAAAIDAVRGTVDRSVWLRSAAMRAVSSDLCERGSAPADTLKRVSPAPL